MICHPATALPFPAPLLLVVEHHGTHSVEFANVGADLHADLDLVGINIHHAAQHAWTFLELDECNIVVAALFGFLAHDGSGVHNATARGFHPLERGGAAVFAQYARKKYKLAAVLALLDKKLALVQEILVHLYRPWATEIGRGLRHVILTCFYRRKTGLHYRLGQA